MVHTEKKTFGLNCIFIYSQCKRPFFKIYFFVIVVTMPRCYSPSDPELNSTAWFAEYIGPFMPFLTLEDLQTFGSAQVLNLTPTLGLKLRKKQWKITGLMMYRAPYQCSYLISPLCRFSRCSL